MSRFWCSSGLGLALAAGCLLPEGSIDPNLPDELAGIGGSSGAGAAGTGGVRGLGGKTVDDLCPTTTDPEEACAEYCDVYAMACSDFVGVYTYANANDCAVTCYRARWPIGTTSEKGSIMCRCFHSTLALTEGQTPHCYHAAKDPTMGGCQVLP